MKKKIAVLCLVSVLALGGCGASGTSSSASSSAVSGSDSSASATESSSSSSESTAVSDATSYDSAPTTADTVSDGDYSDYISIPDYKGIEIKAPDGTVTKTGMTVNIDYKGTIDGTAFDGGTAQGYDLKLGSGQFISGFEDQLTGHKKGDQVDVVVTFPKDYGVDSLNGKEAHFATTINEIYTKTPSEAFSSLLNQAQVKAYPQEMLDKWTAAYKKTYESDAQSANETVDEYLKSAGVSDSMINDTVKNYAKEDMLCRTIAAKEGISEDSDDFKNAHSSVLSSMGVSSDSDAEKIGYSSEVVTTLSYAQVVMNVLVKYEA